MFVCGWAHHDSKIESEYDQEIQQSQTADKPMAPRGRAKQQSRDTRKTHQAKQPDLSLSFMDIKKRKALLSTTTLYFSLALIVCELNAIFLFHRRLLIDFAHGSLDAS